MIISNEKLEDKIYSSNEHR